MEMSMYDAIEKLKTAAAALSTARRRIELEDDDLDKDIKAYMDLSALMIYDVKKFLNNRYPYEGQPAPTSFNLDIKLRHR